jgi:poly-gamma-glutamate capsule biosynthesis protein CapA/YwtB (metallophosphatase superfamily)
MSITLMAVGDTYCSRDEPHTAVEKVSPLIKAADIFFCNLEGPVTNRPHVRGPYPLPQSLKTVDMLRDLGSCVVVSFANNHALDCGYEGFFQTLELLRKRGVRYVGAGKDLAEARSPVVVEVRGVRVAFLAYASFFPVGDPATSYKPGVSVVRVDPRLEPPHIDPDDLAAMKDDMKKAKSEADIVVVSHHWGGEPTYTLTLHQRAIGHASIDAGADLVLGHHPHVLQGIEVYNGKVICYSLSNFIFDPIPLTGRVPDVFRDGWRDSIILSCLISNKKVEETLFYPIVINEYGQPEIPTPEDERFQRIFNLMDKLSKPLGTTLTKKEDKVWVLAK